MKSLLLALCALAFGVTTAAAQSEIELVPAFPNLSFQSPVDIQHPGDGTNRLFVVEQPGVIRVFNNDPVVNETDAFLDITDRVDDSGNEMGLLGLAFHPDFEANGYVFVNYTAGGPRRTVIARYEVNASHPNQADPDSETIILEVEQPYANHNAGQLQFGPDGYLYISLGDGGGGGDPGENGQDVTTLLGSMLRIDVDEPSQGRNYSIPSDNPLLRAQCGPSGCRDEIWAWGFRNPWRFSFDPQSGQLWLADVGQGSWEEVDFVEKGGNYGWNVMEGAHCFEPSSGCDRSGLILPIFEYPRSLGNSITGGYVVRGGSLLNGQYVFGDFGSGRIWTIAADDVAAGATELMDTDFRISTFGVDASGELYLANYTSGALYRFDGGEGTAVDDGSVPDRMSHLAPAHPNPFRESATLIVRLDRPAAIELTIYDVSGRRIRTLASGRRAAGVHELRWDGRTSEGEPAAAAIYIARLAVDGEPAGAQRLVRLPQ